MSRTHVRRRGRERHGTAGHSSQGLIILGGFVVGVGLEWVRFQPVFVESSWRWDTFLILVAAWISVVMLAYAQKGSAHQLPRLAALTLGMLFLGSLIMHEVLYPH